MNIHNRNLIYRVSWNNIENENLPEKVIILNKDSKDKSHLKNNVFYLNKKDYDKNLSITDILYQKYSFRVLELNFMGTCL